MKPVAVVHNSLRVPGGRLDAVLARAEVPRRDLRPSDGDPFPDPGDVAGVIVLGGEMGAYEEDRFPHLVAEKEYLLRLVDAGTPVLGICLGAQLLADALGGKAFLADRPEAGVVDLRVTPAWEADPVLGSLLPRVLAVHQDTFDLPPDAELLAESDRFPHAFRIGPALALQFHPEAPMSVVRHWVATGADRIVRSAGRGVDGFLAEVEAAEPELEPAGSALFDRWLASVAGSGN